MSLRNLWDIMGARPHSIFITESFGIDRHHEGNIASPMEEAMPYICNSAGSFVGQKSGSGQCVEFVRACTHAPPSSVRRQGDKVRGNLSIQRGTAIATFNAHGLYANDSTGNHAAIYDSQDSSGVWVYDQWVKQGSVQKRQISFRGSGSASNDGDAFYVVE